VARREQPVVLRRVFLAILTLALVATLLPASTPAGRKNARGTLSDNRLIESEYLGYRLQYRVYLPAGHDALAELPVLYVADGQWYIEPGGLTRQLDRMIGKGTIEPVIAVFLDNRDPDSGANRRQQQFFCNRDFVRFVGLELTAEIDRTYPTRKDRDARTILGLSFGGLNSACFGLMAFDDFRGIAMQSPSTYPVSNLLEAYEQAPKQDLKFFLSVGRLEGLAEPVRQLKAILKEKGYALFYKEVPYGHDWDNWRPLLADILRFYYGNEEP
jgi:enterochelin esterase-like enzyme